mgnify:FL=1|tara:strand:- start:730 stop:933 length:204 start_codon:yes stop_codon:yes gene_type:complete
MAAYGNVKVKVFIHYANTSTEASDAGTIARDIKDYVASLDSTNNEIISITQSVLRGDRVMTTVVAGT